MKTCERSHPFPRSRGAFIPSCSNASYLVRRLTFSLAACLLAIVAAAQDPEHPLKPPDRSSPRATLQTFLEGGDTVGRFLAEKYLRSPTRARFQHLQELSDIPIQCLDLSEVPPAARPKTGKALATALYETLNRIQLPPVDEIPGADQAVQSDGTNAAHWVIPDTEIALVQVLHGRQSGQFLFSSETVANATDFYERVRELPYKRQVPLEDSRQIMAAIGGGWLIPYAWIRALPPWLRTPLYEEAPWKWILLALLIGLFGLLLRLAYRISKRGSNDQPLVQALLQLVLPAYLILATQAFSYLALVQINLLGPAANWIGLLITGVSYTAGAWIAWRASSVVAEAIISSPKIPPEGVNAHLIRICARLLGIVVGGTLLGIGADRLGLPLYGIIAGLGVGGLAIALAAQPTIENLIGGLSLFADKPIRVGDFCNHGTDVGTVEAIGIRSTRIRGLDRTVTTIPNSVLAKAPVVNFAVRDRMLLKSTIGLRYETKADQLRYVLARLRELLLAHPRVTAEPARVRFMGFGESSLDLEVFAYVATEDWNEFLEIQEDIYLRMMDVISEAGTALAFPSQRLYLTRDPELEPDKSAAAIAQVQQWRKEHQLPFPNFDLEFRKRHRDSLEYPPTGSATAKPKLKPKHE